MNCPKCNKEYSDYPAISRLNSEKICPMCGTIEALDAAGWSEAKSMKPHKYSTT